MGPLVSDDQFEKVLGYDKADQAAAGQLCTALPVPVATCGETGPSTRRSGLRTSIGGLIADQDRHPPRVARVAKSLACGCYAVEMAG